MRPPLIITRPEREALRWVQALQTLGVAAEALPLMTIAPLESETLVAARKNWNRHAALMFVSVNAVEHFFADASLQTLTETVLSPPSPKTVRFLAPGPGTLAALLRAGVPADRIDAPATDASQFDSEALWQVVGQNDWHGKSVLIVRGESVASDGGQVSHGRDWLARQWQAAGASVTLLPAYRRQAPTLSSAQQARASAASHDGSVWLFSSSQAVLHLLQGLKADWSAARAIATHPRIAQIVRTAGWGVVVASRPEINDIRAAWASIESTYDE